MEQNQRKKPRRNSDRLLQKTAEILRILERIYRGEEADFSEAYADLVGMKDQLGRRREDRELGDSLCASIEAIASHLGRPVRTEERRREGRLRGIRLVDMPGNPLMSKTLTNMALLYAAIDQFENARHLLRRAQEIDSKVTEHIVDLPSEEGKIRFLYTTRLEADVFFSLVVKHLIHSPSARRDALDVWFKRRGQVLETQRRFQGALVYADDPQSLNTFQELSEASAELSGLLFEGPGKEGTHAYNKRIEHLESQRDRLKAKLSGLSGAFALKQKIENADAEKVAEALPEDTVLMEFARVEMYNFKTEEAKTGFGPAHYLAFVLHANNGDEVNLVDLGDAELIDRAVASFRKGIGKGNDTEGTMAIESSRMIFDLVFEPLRKKLGDVRDIFISPDGNLNLLPFEVLQDPEGRYLIEDYTFNYLMCGRDILGFGQIKGQRGKALLVGDPDFEMEAEEKDEVLRKLALRKEGQVQVFKRSSEMSGLRFARLPGTREEVRAIRAIIGAEESDLYIGRESLEEVLFQSKAPGILHLATHGFFLSDIGTGDLTGDKLARRVHLGFRSKPSGMKMKIENPLLRSGIALAGANAVLRSEDEQNSDGIITAEKILELRLRGTDMVVLSACDMGLGGVKVGEAVFSLRRSFIQAGAKSLVMSMWSAPDREAKELMVEFYRNIVSGRMSRCQALRQAALAEMKIAKDRYGHSNPRFWGSFVFVGEP